MTIDRDKLKEINKRYSISPDDPIAIFASDIPDDYSYAPTGLLILDWAIGRPGLPKGRIVELYGPNQSGKTAISLVIARSMQDRGEDVVYIDAEHALNPKWLGPLDRSKLLVVQPEIGEQALDIVSETIKAGAGLVIVDSVATLVPKAEAEASFEEKQRGELARMMSKAMRNLAPDVAKSQSILLMINQVRSNMTMYGCFHEDTGVTFADGSIHRIRDVVDDKLIGPVLSYNDTTGEIVSSNITAWHKNGETDRWLTIYLSSSGGKNGTQSFTCTENHRVLTDSGYIPANEVVQGSTMYSWYEERIKNNPVYKDIIYGSLLGDGGIWAKSPTSGFFKLANTDQPDYLHWKLDKLVGLDFRLSSVNRSGRYSYISKSTVEIAGLKEKFYGSNKYREIPDDLELTPLMAAIWFMDDAHTRQDHKDAVLCVKRLALQNQSDKALQILKNFIPDGLLSLTPDKKYIRFDKVSLECLFKKIAPFVIPSMQYKLFPQYRNRYCDLDSGNLDKITTSKIPVKVLAISQSSARKYRSRVRYDITVENTSTYFVGGGCGGVIVHNSPEVSPGGQALQFSASLRIRVQKKEAIKDGNEIVGQKSKLTIVKNKIGAPGREAEFDLMYYGDSPGIDYYGAIFDAAEKCGLLIKRGAYVYRSDGTKFSHGKVDAVKLLQEDKELADELHLAVWETLR